MNEEEKKILSAMAQGLNNELALEKLHRDNMIRHFGTCIIWIAGSLSFMWWPTKLEEFTMVMLTFYGIVIISVSVMSCWAVNRRYKNQMKAILESRQRCLEMKDHLK